MHCGSISQPRIKKEKVPQNPRRFSCRRKSVQLAVDSLTTKATRSKQTQCPILQQFISRPNSSHLHCNPGYSNKFPNKQNQWCPEDRQTHDRSQQSDLTHETDTPGKKEWERKQTSSSTSSKHRKSQDWRRCSWAGWLVTKANSAPSLSLSPSQHSQPHYIHDACRDRRNPIAVSSPSTREHFRVSGDLRSRILPRSRRPKDPNNVDCRFLPPGGSSFSQETVRELLLLLLWRHPSTLAITTLWPRFCPHAHGSHTSVHGHDPSEILCVWEKERQRLVLRERERDRSWGRERDRDRETHTEKVHSTFAFVLHWWDWWLLEGQRGGAAGEGGKGMMREEAADNHQPAAYWDGWVRSVCIT